MQENEMDDDLNFDFDTTGVKTEKEIGAGGEPIPNGKYHVVVDAVEKDQTGANPALKFTFTVLAGTVPNQRNRKLFERLFLTEKNKDRVLIFANRLGLISQAELGQPNVRKNWALAKGKQVIVEVATREYDKKDGTKGKASNITFGGLWKLDDERVKDVPRADGAAKAAAAAPAAGAAAAEEFNDL